MFSLNISCPVCKNNFKNTDALYSTSCGHIFHFGCMNEWKRSSTSCPVCRCYGPSTHPIYINFENGVEYEKVLNDMKGKLEVSEAKYKQLQEEIEKKVKEKDGIKRLYNVSQQWRAELEDKIRALEAQRQQNNAKHLEEIATQSEEIKLLKTHVEILEKNDAGDEQNEKYKEVMMENLKLKKNLGEGEILQIKLNQKIEMLEQRLKYITLELTKQFDESFKKANVPEPLQNKHIAKPNPCNRGQRKRSGTNEKLKDAKCTSLETLNSDTSISITNEEKDFKLTQPNDCRIMVLDFPRENLVFPLKDTIILLASKMALNVTHADILNVELVPPKSRVNHYNKVFLATEFRNIEIKTQFLKFTNRLKFDSTTKTIKVKEYVDKRSHQLFMYANRKLRGNGYQYIACKDSKVIAKKHLHDTEEIVINDENQVEALLRSGTNAIKTYSCFDLSRLL